MKTLKIAGIKSGGASEDGRAIELRVADGIKTREAKVQIPFEGCGHLASVIFGLAKTACQNQKARGVEHPSIPTMDITDAHLAVLEDGSLVLSLNGGDLWIDYHIPSSAKRTLLKSLRDDMARTDQ